MYYNFLFYWILNTTHFVVLIIFVIIKKLIFRFARNAIIFFNDQTIRMTNDFHFPYHITRQNPIPSFEFYGKTPFLNGFYISPSITNISI